MVETGTVEENGKTLEWIMEFFRGNRIVTFYHNEVIYRRETIDDNNNFRYHSKVEKFDAAGALISYRIQLDNGIVEEQKFTNNILTERIVEDKNNSNTFEKIHTYFRDSKKSYEFASFDAHPIVSVIERVYDVNGRIEVSYTEFVDGDWVESNRATGAISRYDAEAGNTFAKGVTESSTGLGRSLDKGDDLIYGSPGDDSFIFTSGSDRIFGLAGNDYILLGGLKSKAWGGAGNDTIDLMDIGTFASGGDGDDQIYLSGYGGENEIDGGSGNDKITTDGFSYKPNTIRGGSGDDYIISGDSSADSINAGPGNDTIHLKGNHYYIDSDDVTGGRGADTFIIDVSSNSESAGIEHDSISDFSFIEGDKIIFSTIDGDFIVTNMQDMSYFLEWYDSLSSYDWERQDTTVTISSHSIDLDGVRFATSISIYSPRGEFDFD